MIVPGTALLRLAVSEATGVIGGLAGMEHHPGAGGRMVYQAFRAELKTRL